MDLRRDHAVVALKKLGMKDADEFLGLYGQKGPFLALEKGLVTPDEFRRTIRVIIGNPDISDADLDAAFNEFLIGIPVHRLKELEQLRKQYKVYLLSNTNAIMWNSKIKEEFAKDGHDINDYFDGVVVVTTKMKALRIRGRRACVQAGASTVTVASELKKRGLSGGEFFACLPATIGGAVVTNAGCFGQQVSDVVRSVKVLCNGKIRTWGRKKCNFGKRKSVFSQKNGLTILSVAMIFTRSNSREVGARIDEMRAKKSASQPLNFRSAGSALYHDRVAVSRLLDEAGLKGYTVGGAQVSTKHAGFVINIDKATSKDIYLVMRHMQSTLKRRFGIDAKFEIRLINFGEEFNEEFTKDGSG